MWNFFSCAYWQGLLTPFSLMRKSSLSEVRWSTHIMQSKAPFSFQHTPACPWKVGSLSRSALVLLRSCPKSMLSPLICVGHFLLLPPAPWNLTGSSSITWQHLLSACSIWNHPFVAQDFPDQLFKHPSLANRESQDVRAGRTCVGLQFKPLSSRGGNWSAQKVGKCLRSHRMLLVELWTGQNSS